MSLTPGVRLGPYEVTTQIGIGGPPPLASMLASYGEIPPKPSGANDA